MGNKLSTNQSLMILNALPNLGPCTYKTLTNHFKKINEIFDADPKFLQTLPGIGEIIADTIVNYKKFFNLEREEQKLRAIGAQFLGCQHQDFPNALSKIYDAPIEIYCMGDELCNNMPKVAIIGSRNATAYGMTIAHRLAFELAQHGICIVSGLARGIDSSAHEGAIISGGKTIAVLGNGVDVIYPQENTLLYHKIISTGAILSEFILGRRADKQTFPCRNRLISGLCDAIIVVESDIHGGSMITAKHAIDQGRHVFAVPGRIDQRSSAGCLALIRAGASIIRSVDDLFDEIPYLNNKAQQNLLFTEEKNNTSKPQISCPVGRKIYEILSNSKPLDFDTLANILEIPVQTIATSYQMLEIYGHIERLYDGKIRIKNT